jgi:5'-3' exonuclease
LLCIIPPQLQSIIPIEYRKIINKKSLKSIFPAEILLDMSYKEQYWQCEAILKAIDLEDIKELTKDIKIKNNKKNVIDICMIH